MHWLNCKGFLLKLQMCTYYCKVWKEKRILWNRGFIIYSFKTIDLSHQIKTYSRVYKLGNMVREAERCRFYLSILIEVCYQPRGPFGVGGTSNSFFRRYIFRKKQIMHRKIRRNSIDGHPRPFETWRAPQMDVGSSNDAPQITLPTSKCEMELRPCCE